jgi:Ca2+/Na+ antiporter
VFSGYTNKQKRDNVRFIHGMTVFGLGMFFLFAPSRSWQRILAFSLYVVFILLYITLGDCWVYQVENEFFSEKNDDGVLGPLRTLLGLPDDENTKRVFTSVGYFFVCFIGSCILVRDSFGIY